MNICNFIKSVFALVKKETLLFRVLEACFWGEVFSEASGYSHKWNLVARGSEYRSLCLFWFFSAPLLEWKLMDFEVHKAPCSEHHHLFFLFYQQWASRPPLTATSHFQKLLLKHNTGSSLHPFPLTKFFGINLMLFNQPTPNSFWKSMTLSSLFQCFVSLRICSSRLRPLEDTEW